MVWSKQTTYLRLSNLRETWSIEFQTAVKVIIIIIIIKYDNL